MQLRLIFSAIVLYLTFFNPTTVRANVDVERGRAAAEKFCARCHVIGKNEFGGIGSTMSFYMMAENIDRYEPRLRTVTERRPHIALKLDLKDNITRDLIAYIKQLDWRARWKRIMPRK